MKATDHTTTTAIRYATAVSVLMIAYQVAARATRDALFLTRYDVIELPRMVATASLLGLVAVVTFSRLMGRFGPGRLVPKLFAISAVLQLIEWALLPLAPRPVTMLVYLHLSSFGALLVSGFWSLFNERLDPRTAKKNVGFIGAAGTAGGVAGGLMAERVGALLAVPSMLPLLAALHLVCAALALRLRAAPVVHKDGAPAPAPPEAAAGLRTLAASPYLRTIAGALTLATISQGMFDYVLNATAKATFGPGEVLLRFFALFYAAINVLGMVFQAGFGARTLEKLGVARTVGTLPWATAAGGLGAIALPGLPSILLVKTSEAVLRNSLYRSGYEMLFTPLPAGEKRTAKALLDVGVIRVGDMLAAGLVQLALLVWFAHAQTLMLCLAVICSAFNIMLTFHIHRGYVATLERNLISRAVHLSSSQVRDRTTRLTMAAMQALPNPPAMVFDQDAEFDDEDEGREKPVDPLAARFTALRSADAETVRAALRDGPLDVALVRQAVTLLARDDVAADVHEALDGIASRHTGLLVDALLDPASDFAVRRRLPLVIAGARSRRALDGLLSGLDDERFEVRFRCGRALARLRETSPELAIAPERVHLAVLREIAVERGVWESQRVIEQDLQRQDFDLDGVVKERASRSLSHVFTVLSLVLPREPLQIAFRGLHGDDPHLRGTALEYLETALPPLVREKLWPFLDDAPRKRSDRKSEDVVADLIRNRESIALSVEAVRKLRESLDSGETGTPRSSS